MALTLAQIDRVVLRQIFPTWVRQQCRLYDLPIPDGWPDCLDDEALAALAHDVAEMYREPDDDE